jgi:Endonuclease/Exonuclease/phosphatase family
MQFSLLSLNTFGLPLFLGWARLSRLMRELDQYSVSVLCFQEIHQNGYVPLLQRGLPDYPHHAFKRGVLAPKGGLFTAARVPLGANEFIGYKNRGRLFSLGFADWALKKGVLVSALRIQDQRIVVMNTHLHANYAGNWDPEDPMTRVQRDQVQHLARMVNQQPADALVIVCGDFNFPRGSFLYHELLAATGLEDPLAHDARPTFRPLPPLPRGKWSVPIDFCLVRRPAPDRFRVQADIVHVQATGGSRPHQRFLTDHNALTLHVAWDQ